ncbi:flagellar motor protein MotD [Janthinobacterium sp. 17J80-10]|uniref:flagellar motor protein MotD n=1 Tax=Janthinobacterium sp. 17J80-10 TaxID=2497863 RepID=UPI0010059E0D|nr:flagellar motor protein MotD [Janthinobacterium sp. 17J80-10]QAU34334.1 flagellar motor protein MotD [Janthinobacterium sp. 17J80-10]
MARKKQEEEHENHERWLVSYADFITLLFAFFVVMYAISSVNEGKYRVLSNSLGSAFGTGAAVSVTQVAPERQQAFPLARQARPDRQQIEALRQKRTAMTDMARKIQVSLAPLVQRGIVRVTQTSRGVKVEINASILFAPGDARLSTTSGEALTVIAEIVKDDSHALQVEGHTDNVPISNALFASNWELSSARASSVVRLFADNGVGQHRLTAVGHADNVPVGTNATPEGRLRNRRVEVLILADLPEKETEVPITPANP